MPRGDIEYGDRLVKRVSWEVSFPHFCIRYEELLLIELVGLRKRLSLEEFPSPIRICILYHIHVSFPPSKWSLDFKRLYPVPKKQESLTMCCPVAKHISGCCQDSSWPGFLWEQKQRWRDLVTRPSLKMNFTSCFQKRKFILRWSSFLYQWASVTGWKQEAVKRVDRSLKPQAGKFIFANSLVMVWIVQVVTNFVVHFITLPLHLWGAYLGGSAAAKINRYTALPLSCPARCNLLSCHVRNWDFLGWQRSQEHSLRIGADGSDQKYRFLNVCVPHAERPRLHPYVALVAPRLPTRV